MTLREMFRDDFASSAFQTIDGEPQIVGKYGRITRLDDGTFDCWFVGPDLSPLTTHRLRAIARKINSKWGFRELTGEGYSQSREVAFVREVAVLIGVRKRRRLSQATREKLSANMRRMREAATA